MVDIAVIEGSAGHSPASVDAAEVIQLLRSHGAVQFKGFDCTSADFVELTNRYGNRHTCDPSKVTGGRLQTLPGRAGEVGRLAARIIARGAAAAGIGQPDDRTRVAPVDGYGINPHNENTFIPGAVPDLVWFLCARPAVDGGSTLLCDGRTLWQALSGKARDYAASTLVRYELTLRRPQWHAVYDVADVGQLEARVSSIVGAQCEIDRSGSLRFVYEVDQVGSSLFDGETVLSTNVLSRRPFGQVGHNELERVASGDPLPPWFVQELLDTSADLQVMLDLESADLVMIDNTRVMHGRTAFTDAGRRVFTRCSWLDPTLAAGA